MTKLGLLFLDMGQIDNAVLNFEQAVRLYKKADLEDEAVLVKKIIDGVGENAS